MREAAHAYIEQAAHEHLQEVATEHLTVSGDYSEAVLTFVLQYHHNMYSLGVNSPVLPTLPECMRIFSEDVAAVIVNMDNRHWVALKVVNHEIWILDSTRKPEVLSQDSYQAFLLDYPTAYPLMILSTPG